MLRKYALRTVPPAGLVGMPQRLLLTVLDQVIVERLEQGQEPLQAIGQRAL